MLVRDGERKHSFVLSNKAFQRPTKLSAPLSHNSSTKVTFTAIKKKRKKKSVKTLKLLTHGRYPSHTDTPCLQLIKLNYMFGGKRILNSIFNCLGYVIKSHPLKSMK